MTTSCPRCQRSYDDGVRFCPVDGEEVVTGADPVLARNVGRVLAGQFELRELAGRGATGTVWRAYQKSMDRIVAVKILHPELVRDPDAVRRFQREARAIAKIVHPNIVTVHLVGETEEGVPYLVMEHVDGISVETVIEAQGALPIARVLHLGKQIASGLGEAHANGIIHRDLKPANLLVTDRGRIADTVKILDFGIAKLIQPGKEVSQLTRGEQVFGTPHYMAPEQGAGEPVDARTDLYALGVVLFRLATGQVPFDAPAAMHVVLSHLRDLPPRPRTLNPLIPEALERLILLCLEKRPQDRPVDAEDVFNALVAVGESAPAPRSIVTLPRAVKAAEPTRGAERIAPDAATIAAPDGPALSGMLSGPHSRPDVPSTGRSTPFVVGIILFLGVAVLAALRFAFSPTAGAIVGDLAPAAVGQDLAPTVAAVPDRPAADLIIPTAHDLSTPPDLALVPDLARVHHHHDSDDLPVTVFGPDDPKPAARPSPPTPIPPPP